MNTEISKKKELKATQPAMDIQQQIQNLQSLGLIIDNVDFAEKFLNDVSYFRFIKAYSLGLKEKNGSYYEKVTFEQLVQLYLFNANFRQLLFAQIEKIEINLRCRLSNYFCLKYGVMGYKNPDNFAQYPDMFKKGMERELEQNKRSPFVRNFQQNYENGNIPFYAAVEFFSFGTLSKFYKNMNGDDKKAVSAYYAINYTYFESWIESISYVRNICAHYGRLYNAKLTKTPRLYSQDKKYGISNKRIMGTLICLKHLLPGDKHWNEFIDAIDQLVTKYPFVQIETMGFPENWKKILTETPKL